MEFQSENFVVRGLHNDDKENMRVLEWSRPWVKPFRDLMDHLTEVTASGEQEHYFEGLWNDYQKEPYLGIIERKPGIFCGDIQIDMDASENEAHLYIQLLENANIAGFGTELFETVIEYISKKMGVKTFYVELWNEADKSKEVYTEAGYSIENGYLEIQM
jgi:RimJ/RimL family protein N-acetyltransferase